MLRRLFAFFILIIVRVVVGLEVKLRTVKLSGPFLSWRQEKAYAMKGVSVICQRACVPASHLKRCVYVCVCIICALTKEHNFYVLM